MKRLVRALVPPTLRQPVRWAVGGLTSWVHRGGRVECPCCGGRFRHFLPQGVLKRPNARCPRCGSLERHRLLWLYFRDRTTLLSAPARLLHIAPEYLFHRLFRSIRTIDYVSADLASPLAMEHFDITAIPHPDASFDVILCSHVLEHVPDDRAAMREFRRVLRPGGWAILQSPIDLARSTTFEDPTVASPAERERLFGQDDHVRVYGLDYFDRLREAGFAVERDAFVQTLGAERIARFGLMADEEVVRCTIP